MPDESHNVRQRTTRPQQPSDAMLDEHATTVRTTPVDVDLDSLPEQASLYVAPQPVPRVSEHKTIDMVPVRLAPDVDPRNALTRRLETVSRMRARGVRLLGGALAVLLLVGAGLGALRWLESRSYAVQTTPPGDTQRELSESPAVAAVMPGPTLDQKAAARPAPRVTASSTRGLAPSAPRASSSARPAATASSKGRDLWIE